MERETESMKRESIKRGREGERGSMKREKASGKKVYEPRQRARKARLPRRET